VSRATALAAALVALAATACGFDRRSPGYACQPGDDCGAGRTCSQGWCVDIGGDAGDAGGGDAAPVADADPNQPDAALGGPDAFVCPGVCSSCTVDGTCIIACDATGSCASGVVCPAGIPCKVECNGASSCAGAIDCSAATSCRVECTNQDACAGAIACGSGVCRVECGGSGSCSGGIDCVDACQCDTFCTGSGSCAVAPTCPPPSQCTTGGGECTGVPGPCNSC